MAVPDLAAARESARATLVDECAITRDLEGFDDDAIDPDTLEFVPPGGDAAAVYAGPCLVGASTADIETQAGGQVLATGRRHVRLPFDAVLPKAGDILTITDVGPQSDPTLLNVTYRVISAEPHSIYVTRLVEVERTTVVT